MGGDGATYDIGFGALSRLLSTVDADQGRGAQHRRLLEHRRPGLDREPHRPGLRPRRFGAAHAGKQEERKELGLIAAFHPNVFVVQSCAALQAHFLKHVVEFLNHNDSPAVLDVYTPCQGEQGIADPQASRHARLAVESRMNPVFVHDPRRGADLHSRFSLDGNPDPDKDWTTNTIEYVEDGATKLMEAPLTPADFALSEGRFQKQFRTLAADAGRRAGRTSTSSSAWPTAAGKTPFVWSTDDDKKLIKVGASADDRPPGRGAPQELADPAISRRPRRREARRGPSRRSGSPAARSTRKRRRRANPRSTRSPRDVRAGRVVQGAVRRRAVLARRCGGLTTRLISAGARAPAPAAKGNGSGAGRRLPTRTSPKCTNCKTCYQEVPELFEKTRIVVDGAAKEVGHLIPGALERVKVTPELKARIARVAANCDAEIIHEH